MAILTLCPTLDIFYKACKTDLTRFSPIYLLHVVALLRRLKCFIGFVLDRAEAMASG